MLTIAALLHGTVAVQHRTASFSAEGVVETLTEQITGATCPADACGVCDKCRHRANREYGYLVTCIKPKVLPCNKIQWCADYVRTMTNQCYQEQLQQKPHLRHLRGLNVANACITQGLCKSPRTQHCKAWRNKAGCHRLEEQVQPPAKAQAQASAKAPAHQARARTQGNQARVRGRRDGKGRKLRRGKGRKAARMMELSGQQVHRASDRNDVNESESLIGRAHTATAVDNDLDTSVQGKCGA